ncbi:carboxylating nicotinate-nucleotide diphosphorylase [Alkalibacillus haloalkaliphilus]|uniref:carboxylating nicotinate-nucleotide diphosphorylase n=1 Tax=Alkalibacillus haloalkaliphilus TaxID=94136 RepID=UPI0029365C1E|nr:carboxylating nicotinate-nucleotide diphosphorylase [Alkalibacillus haloalkaliphilus]MDV2580921.1 carboxylating nicotinate-nucleotide diphosphorylase [Alkalibacillus haloalkaliphilus]
MLNKFKLEEMVKAFFIEDLGDLDVTTDSIFNEKDIGTLTIQAKEAGIFCGQLIIESAYHLLDREVDVTLHVEDGERVEPTQEIARIHGPVPSLLKGERVVLNLIQRLSGIATKTNKAVNMLDSDYTKISDTRKTTPGLRMLEKYAVRVGGGINHRLRLDDAVMIKDNHIAFAGSISEAVNRVRKNVGHMVKVEVEAENEQHVLEAVEANVDVIMLDNVELDQLYKLIQLIPRDITTELSGGIEIQDLPKYRELNVDVISMGCLTHQIESLDYSANQQFEKERV